MRNRHRNKGVYIPFGARYDSIRVTGDAALDHALLGLSSVLAEIAQTVHEDSDCRKSAISEFGIGDQGRESGCTQQIKDD